MTGNDKEFCYYTRTENAKAFRSEYTEGAHCGNVFRMVSSETSSAIKSCACASIAFLTEIICLVVEYVLSQVDVFGHPHCV
jgi:hypothetical protein